MGGSEQRGMGAQQQQGGVGAHVRTGRPRLEKATALEKASGGGPRCGCASGGCMRAAMKKEILCFFIFYFLRNRVIPKIERRRCVESDGWAGLLFSI
jgi:hypothetical protein